MAGEDWFEDEEQNEEPEDPFNDRNEDTDYY